MNRFGGSICDHKNAVRLNQQWYCDEQDGKRLLNNFFGLKSEQQDNRCQKSNY